MKADYSLYTFVTSLGILALQIQQKVNTTIRDIPQSGNGPLYAAEHSRSTPRNRTVVSGEYGLLYADLRIPHPSYVVVSDDGEEQPPLDMPMELEKLRIAANTQRAVLTAAGRMPPETPVSKMIAQRTRAYMAEDAEARATSVSRRTPQTTSVLALWKQVSSSYPNQVGVILGVGSGELVISLLREWKSTFIYLVDPYIHIWRGYSRPANIDDKNHQLIYENLRQKLSIEFERQFMFIRDFSTEFALTYKKATGQPRPAFVLIDANPSYLSVKADLEAWYPLLAPGGLMAGTLYRNDGDSIQVKRAVDEFARGRQLTVHLFEDSLWAFKKLN
jgi:hypothetical protein